MRHNQYREEILAVLKLGHLMSVAEVYRQVGQADYSTVYRNLKQLEAAGAVRSVVVKHNLKLYETLECNRDHFACLGCGSVQAVNIKSLLPRTVGKVSDVLVRGYCRDCSDNS